MYVGMSAHTQVYKCIPKNIWKNVFSGEENEIRKKKSDEGKFLFYYV